MSSERWCKLRGNLLFYFKTNDQFSEPAGVIVLEKYKVTVHNEQSEYDGYAFYIGRIESIVIFQFHQIKT